MKKWRSENENDSNISVMKIMKKKCENNNNNSEEMVKRK